ncbi:MAG: hypothetical protein H6859_07410 [Rhodospirillales bacterium]|nr:hypothetical protein [Alphaproteobacteria bacterium]USO04981.1 MAG: hypothetical protein H6859_07410 [Rhodospirillales bacterium]
MPTSPKTDQFSGIERIKDAFYVHWTHAVDETGEGYLEPAGMFEDQAHKMRSKGQELPAGMKKAEQELDRYYRYL